MKFSDEITLLVKKESHEHDSIVESLPRYIRKVSEGDRIQDLDGLALGQCAGTYQGFNVDIECISHIQQVTPS
jgi:hypothetical protein